MAKGWQEEKDATPPAWPAPRPAWLQIAKAEPVTGLNLSRLPPAEKRAKWDEIRHTQPELAALLKDPTLQALIKTFDAEVLIENDKE